jgi:hypothetical protein
MKLIMENWNRFLKEGTGTGLTTHRTDVMKGERKGFINALNQALTSDRSLEGDPIDLWAKGGEFQATPARGGGDIGVDYVITRDDLAFIANEIGSFVEEEGMVELVPVINKLKELEADAPLGGTDFTAMSASLKDEYIRIANKARGEITMDDAPSQETGNRLGRQASWSAADLMAKMRSLK